MRVLVTGGTGYLGAHTIRALTEAGHEVGLLVRCPERIRPALDRVVGAGEAPEATSGRAASPPGSNARVAVGSST